MSKNARFMSLRSKLFLIMTLAVLAAALVFVSVRELGNFLVWRYYLDEATKQERAEEYVEEFQNYVFENKLSVNDSEGIAEWSAGSYVDIILYKDSSLVYAPEWFVGSESESEEDVTALETESHVEETTAEAEGEVALEGETVISPLGGGVHVNSAENVYADDADGFFDGSWFSGDRSFEQYLTEEAREAYRNALDELLDGNRELRPVYFVDGTLLITVVDYTEEFVYNLVTVTGVIAAFFVLAVIMIFNFTGMATRVNRLAHNVKLVESGNLDMPIVLDGNDELTALAGDVNSMRNAVVDNMTKERQAWEANAELITAMSHDIRTPLTVLLGYLDLIEMENKEGESAEYIAACKENALRLKRLSDDMFSYFLVFGRREVSLDLSEEIDCDSLEHMLAERAVLLEESGFTVERRDGTPRAAIRIDPDYFSRVLDNIFTNLNKYADPAQPVSFAIYLEDRTLTLTVENRVRVDECRAESNGIGNKTCARIMTQMGGSFRAFLENGVYRAVLKIPATPMEDAYGDSANT